MAKDRSADILSEAISWRIRLRHGDAEQWEGFVAWLEADPARSDAYDSIAAADVELGAGDVPRPLVAANDESVRPGKPRRWFPAAAVAAVAAGFAAVTASLVWQPAVVPIEISTRPGEHRTLALADGTSVALNGATRLRYYPDASRRAELTAGEAMFVVRHDSDRPFEVLAGGHVVRDVGTRFNLLSDGQRLSLEVIEGAVLYDPDGEGARLAAGQVLRSDGGNRVLARAEPGAMAGWRSGQLSYESAPLENVVRDLARATGADVQLDPALDQLPFTGSIRIDPDDAVTIARLAEALGVQHVRRNGGWLLEPHRRASR